MSCNTTKIDRLQTAELLARIVGWAGVPIVRADIFAISYSAFIFHEATGEEEVAVGYENLPLTPIASYLDDVLQLNVKWNEDYVGYNFHFTPPAEVFSNYGELYLIRIVFDPVNPAYPNLQAVFYLEVE